MAHDQGIRQTQPSTPAVGCWIGDWCSCSARGGVGRSTLAAAIGVLAARRGRRAIVVEVSGRGDVPRLFDRTVAPGVESELASGLWTLDVDPRQALEEYLRDQLPLRVIADAIGSSATFGYVAAATPGLRELLTIGKIWELA